MKIVITGTTGFVGSNVKAFLVSKGYTIVDLNRKSVDGSFNIEDPISPTCSGQVWIHLAARSKDVQNVKMLNDYQEANVELTKKIFNAFLRDSSASTFIYFSSVKAAAARVQGFLTEEDEFEVDVPYGLSKKLAEKYLLSIPTEASKRLIILRPAMIYGPNSKGNLVSLYTFIRRGLPYPFAAFSNSRSLLSIQNLTHVVLHIIKNPGFKSGIYNVADDNVISTTEIIELIGKSLSKKPLLWRIPKNLITGLAAFGEKLHLPFNSKVINKLTDNYAVSNKKLIDEMGRPLPYNTQKSLMQFFESLKSTK